MIRVVNADIATVEADAIVNAANNHLWMGSGVAGALKRAGGQAIEDEAIARGPIKIGDAIATTAGALRAKWVFHAAVMGQDLKTDGYAVRSATRTCLDLAKLLGAKSIAFPALGTGVGGFDLKLCARIMIGAVKRRAEPDLDVTFVLWGAEALLAFEREVISDAT